MVIPYFIGICGGSASGKTSIAKVLSDDVGGKVPIISLDWYYLPLKDKSLGPTHNWDHPNAFNWQLLIMHIAAWKSGESVWTPRHDYANYETQYNVEKVDAAPVMIIEGILTFADSRVRDLLDVMIYVKCDQDTALMRRLIRDQTERGYSNEEIMTRYRTHVKPAFEEFIAPAEKLAHFTIYNNGRGGITDGKKITHKGVDLIADYIRLKIEYRPKDVESMLIDL